MKDFIKLLRFIYPLCAVLFIGSVFTGAYLQDRDTSAGNSFTAATWTPSPTPASVVINEFMANPVGAEPDGEWIELYNKGGSSADVNGWVLYDALDTHALPISASNVAGGSTVISAGGYLVVNYEAPSTFSLNNSGSETVRLLDGLIGSGALIDSTSYTNTIEGKTWARIPNATGAFSDNHSPTPGGENV